MEIKMTIIYEKADGLIQASVAELPGAISLGADVDEARRNLDEAIEMVLEGNRLLAEDVWNVAPGLLRRVNSSQSADDGSLNVIQLHRK
jgi:predicted RNase H-like HicB family nuclease